MKSSTNQETKPTESSFKLNCSQHEVLQHWLRVAFLHPVTIEGKKQAKLIYIEGEDLVNFKDYCSRISSGEPVSHSTYSDLLKSALEFSEKTTNPQIMEENDTETVSVDVPSDRLQIDKNEYELSDCTDKMLDNILTKKEIVRMAMNQPDGLMDLLYGEELNLLIDTIDTIDNHEGEEIPIQSLYDLKKSEYFDDYVNEDDVNKMIDKYTNFDDDTNPMRNNVIFNTCEDTVNIYDDKRLYCEHCNEEVFGHCPKHKTVLVLDNPLPRTAINRASLSTPYPLEFNESKGRFGGLGVFTTENLPCCLVFGPYQGIFSQMSERKADYGYRWYIRTMDLKEICVDAVHTSVSNWMRYIKCGRDDKEVNLAAFLYNGNIYYRTIRNIPRATELMVWYGDDFGEELGLAPVTPKVVNHISSNESSSCLHSFKHDFTSSIFGKKDKLNISKLRNEKSVFWNENVENLTQSNKNQASNDKSINYDDLNVDKENFAVNDGTKKKNIPTKVLFLVIRKYTLLSN